MTPEELLGPPRHGGSPEKTERNELIRRSWRAGVPISTLAADHGVSPARISQIVRTGDRTTTCYACGDEFTPEKQFGRRPSYCPRCRGEDGPELDIL